MDSKSKFDILLENFSKDKSDATIEKLEVVKTFISRHMGKRSGCVYLALRFMGVPHEEATQIELEERELERKANSFIALS